MTTCFSLSKKDADLLIEAIDNLYLNVDRKMLVGCGAEKKYDNLDILKRRLTVFSKFSKENQK